MEIEKHPLPSSDDVGDKEKIRKLEAQVAQLKNIIVKLTGQKDDSSESKKKSGRGRPFNFNAYKVLSENLSPTWNLLLELLALARQIRKSYTQHSV